MHLPDAENMRTIIGRCLKAAGITALAFVLSMLLIAPFSFSANSLISAPDRNDFNVTDFYTMIADRRPVRQLSDDIVIVNIDTCDRADIASILRKVSLLEPRAVGLDVVFGEPREGDEELIAAARECPNLVAGNAITPVGKRFELEKDAWFPDSVAGYALPGIVNIPARYAYSNIREFTVSFPLTSGDSVPGFVTAIASVADPAAAAELKARGKHLESINYPSHEFTVVEPDEIADRADDMIGKIILIGAVTDPSDLHATPVNGRMCGIEIHARALQTILDRAWLDTLPSSANWAIALALCFLIVLISGMINPGYKGVLMRVLQVGILYLILRVGYWLFIDHGIVVDCSYTLLTLTFGLFAADLWNGTYYIIGRLGDKARAFAARRRNAII